MNWWNKNKRTFPFVFGGVLLLTGAAIVVLMLIGPLVTDQFCTLVGCLGDGVHIILVGEIPDSYSVEVDFPSGKRSVSCFTLFPVRRDDFPGDSCTEYGAFFEQIDSQSHSDKPPEKLTVTVDFFNGQRITKTFHPDYQISYPNGEHCDPMCYYATIYFDISE
ncbi:MAG: hypothetical protein ACOYZ8_09750 [Chloroflexota bacterium]